MDEEHDSEQTAQERTRALGASVREQALSKIGDVAASELGNAASSTVGKALADAVGAATAGGSHVAFAMARVALGETPDERVERVAREIDRDAALRVPAIERRIALTAVEVAGIRDALRAHVEAHRSARTAAFEMEIVRLVAAGSLSVHDLAASPHLRDAILDAYRRAMDTISPQAARPLARLAARYRDRPIDRLHRVVGRALADLDDGEFVALRALMGACVEVSAGTTGPDIAVARRDVRDGGAYLARAYLVQELRTPGVFARESVVDGTPSTLDAIVEALVATGAATVEVGMASDWEGLSKADDQCVIARRVVALLDDVLRDSPTGGSVPVP